MPTETGILATCAAVATLWAPYYEPSWQLSLVAVFYNVDGEYTPLPVVPVSMPVSGTYSGASVPDPRVRRKLSLYSVSGRRWRVWLQQLTAGPVGTFIDVSSSGGGLDARDRAWYAYASSDAAGIVGSDGERFQPGGKLIQWWDRGLAPGGPFVVSG